MPIAEADVQARLKTLLDPNTGRDFVSGKAVKKVAVAGADVAVDVVLGRERLTVGPQHRARMRIERYDNAFSATGMRQ